MLNLCRKACFFDSTTSCCEKTTKDLQHCQETFLGDEQKVLLILVCEIDVAPRSQEGRSQFLFALTQLETVKGNQLSLTLQLFSTQPNTAHASCHTLSFYLVRTQMPQPDRSMHRCSQSRLKGTIDETALVLQLGERKKKESSLSHLKLKIKEKKFWVKGFLLTPTRQIFFICCFTKYASCVIGEEAELKFNFKVKLLRAYHV